jgi:nuclear GTP-binding protein
VDFLTKLARKTGRLIKGGEPDLKTVSVFLINDFQRVRGLE